MNINEVFLNIEEHLLKDDKPSIYLNNLKFNGELDELPFYMIKRLERVDQSPKHHPEGNVWNHTMMVIDNGAKYRDKADDKRAFMWSLLLHDIGKFNTTKIRKGRLTSYDHDKVGEKEGREFLNYFTNDKKFIEKVTKLIRYHMHLLFLTNNLPYADKEGLRTSVNINDMSLVFLSDRLGRGGIDKNEEKKVKNDVIGFFEEYSGKH